MKQDGPPLVVRFGALGDMVMLTPMLRAVSERFGRPCDVVSSGAWSKDLYDGLNFVRNVELIRSRRTPYLIDREQRELVERLRRRERGPVWVIDKLPKVHWLIRRAGYPESAIVSVLDHPGRAGEHSAEHKLRLGEIDPEDWAGTGVSVRRGAWRPDLAVSETEIADCRSWCGTMGVDPQKVVVVQPGNKRTMVVGWRRRSSNVKYWPERRWSSVIESLMDEDDGLRIILNATRHELGIVNEIRANLSPRARASTFVGQLPLRRLIALLSLAHSCISTDSGPAHVAAAVDCPVVALFGSTDPRANRPLGRPSCVRTVFSGAGGGVISADGSEWQPDSDMLSIRPSLVMDAWRQIAPRSAGGVEPRSPAFEMTLQRTKV